MTAASGGSASGPAASRAGDVRRPGRRNRVRSVPDWAWVLVVYAASRLFSGVLVARTARSQAPSDMSGPDPDYLSMTSLWDGYWYRRIAEGGYPPQVPRDAAGLAFQNEWAFYPLFPYLVRAVMSVTGTGWLLAASTVSLLLGAAAVVVMYWLVARVGNRRLAFGAVLLFCCFPTAPVMQFAYTESLATLLVVSCLYLLVTHRYLAAVPVVLALGLSRPVALPFALVVGIHVLGRWSGRRRGSRELFPRTEMASSLVLGAGSVGAGFLWPALVWAATGEREGYTDTMAAWRSGDDVVPFQPWWDNSRFLLGERAGPLLLAAVLTVFTAVVLSRWGRRVGSDLQAWCLAYLAYLLAVLDPFTSTFRYLLLLFPFGAIVTAMVPRRWTPFWLAIWTIGLLLLQVRWVETLWHFTPPSDWPP